MLLSAGLVGEHGHEQALAGQQPLPRSKQRAHDAAPLLLAAIAEDRFHVDAGSHVHHRPRLGHGALTRIELHFDELHLAADDPEVDFVRAAPGVERRRRRGRAAPVDQELRELRNVLERRPVAHPGGEHERVAVNRPVPQVGHDVVLRHRPDLVTPDRHIPLLHVCSVASTLSANRSV